MSVWATVRRLVNRQNYTATGHIHWHVIDVPGTTDRTENDR